jgi:hypothetical protein
VIPPVNERGSEKINFWKPGLGGGGGGPLRIGGKMVKSTGFSPKIASLEFLDWFCRASLIPFFSEVEVRLYRLAMLIAIWFCRSP